jgi:hypothetical protein
VFPDIIWNNVAVSESSVGGQPTGVREEIFKDITDGELVGLLRQAPVLGRYLYHLIHSPI